MRRRNVSIMLASGFTMLSLGTMECARALTLADLSNADASKGLQTALEKGALSAVGLLGVTDGFMGNEKGRIPLPGSLNGAVNMLRTFGQGGLIDELLLAMNRGAEAAVPMAKDLLVNAVQTMSVAGEKGRRQHPAICYR